MISLRVKLQPGILNKKQKKSKVGVEQIAGILNISKSTVSRALNNNPRISQATKDRVKQVALELGYTPNIPDLMAPEKSKTIVVIVPEIETGYHREIIQGIQSFYQDKGFQILISDVNNSQNQLKSAVQLSENIPVSGIILLAFDKALAIGELMNPGKQALPFVLIHQGEENVVASKVIPDLFQGVAKATKHLIKSHHSKIALLLHSPGDIICSEMLNACKAAFNEQEIIFSDEMIKFKNETPSGIKENLSNLFSGNEIPNAIITRTPQITTQVLNFMAEKNLKVPEDVMIVSLGSESNPALNSIGIATIQIDGKEIGVDAASLLFEQINSPEKTPKTIIKPVNFIIKSSAIRV